MTKKLHKVAKHFKIKLAESEEDIYYDLEESKRRQSNYADIDWLKQLASQMWNKRAWMESAVTNSKDSFKVLRYLQTLLNVTRHLVKTAKGAGMDLASAKRYKEALKVAIQGLSSIPGSNAWGEWHQSFGNSLDNFEPRVFYPSKRNAPQRIDVPTTMITSGPPREMAYEVEEDVDLPPGLFNNQYEPRKIMPFPLGAIKGPGNSAYYPTEY